VKGNARLPREAVLADGSYLTTIYPSEKDRQYRTRGVGVRAIEYRLEGVADAEPLYRLVTTILDPASTTAGFEVKFVVSNGFSGLAAGDGGASATRRVRPRGQVAGPRPDATAGGAPRAR
jgi:hypothetical protein